MNCTYCGKPTKLVKGSEILCGYAPIANKWFWECLPCDAHVGCHGNSTIPLGFVAKDDLRAARAETHKYFDQLWGLNKRTRDAAYSLLKRQFHLTVFEAHIGLFTVRQCNMVIEVCKAQIELEKK